MIRSYESQAAEMPYQTAFYWRSRAIARPGALIRSQFLDALKTWDNITVESALETVREQIFEHPFGLEYYYAGNVDHDRAVAIARKMTNMVKKLTGVQRFVDVEDERYDVPVQVVSLPEKSCFRLQVNNTVQTNNAIFITYELSGYSRENYYRAKILAQMLEKSIFYILRTQKQLGYIVSSGLKADYNAVLSFYVIV